MSTPMTVTVFIMPELHSISFTWDAGSGDPRTDTYEVGNYDGTAKQFGDKCWKVLRRVLWDLHFTPNESIPETWSGDREYVISGVMHG